MMLKDFSEKSKYENEVQDLSNLNEESQVYLQMLIVYCVLKVKLSPVRV